MIFKSIGNRELKEVNHFKSKYLESVLAKGGCAREIKMKMAIPK
jgi:hypothetical protein